MGPTRLKHGYLNYNRKKGLDTSMKRAVMMYKSESRSLYITLDPDKIEYFHNKKERDDIKHLIFEFYVDADLPNPYEEN